MKNTDITDGSGKWYQLGPFTVFDTETTGMSPSRDRIVEIAAIRIDSQGQRGEFQSLVNPGISIPASASRVHRITDSCVRDYPDFYSIGKRFIEFAAGSTLVAHNARFDLGFLQESLHRYHLPLWQGQTMDSIPIIRKAYPGLPSYSLQNLRISLGLGTEMDGPAHRALADAEWTLEAFAMAMQELICR